MIDFKTISIIIIFKMQVFFVFFYKKIILKKGIAELSGD
jgi:hypothetical protein